MVNLKEALSFKGTWRTYQKRVLDHSQQYLEDKKIHIVAAPGSGKTTLGIELIGRTGKPCLILSPSIVIRQQWISRIKEAFLPDNVETTDSLSTIDLLSVDIRNPAPITAITYQALHSAVTRQKNNESKNTLSEEGDIIIEETDEISAETSADYSDFDIIQTVKNMGIGTICLDECHHLKNEWWKALEDFMKNFPDVTVISLTATPPYDSSPAQWERYINLCGAIDEEIIVPELVREGSLCPHQDYIYFNYPTKEEENIIKDFKKDAKKMIDFLMADQTFAQMISTHSGLKNITSYEETFLDYPAYLSSLLIFLKEKKIPFSSRLTHLLGVKSLPKMNEGWMEILLQGFLYEDIDSYASDKVYREQLIKELKSYHLIVRNKVSFTANDSLEKMLVTSKGKVDSISQIVQKEYSYLQKDLRLLILTDYIRKEHFTSIGNMQMDVTALGVVPFFETLRRKNINGLHLGILCGTIIVIPTSAVERLQELAAEHIEMKDKINAKELTDNMQNPLGYSEITISGKKHISTSLITKLFEEGYMHVLIGTKALLGEGWDSPCINSLILASFVGSYVLSNQMRGRAIRVMKNNPDKTSNIWHLVCMFSENKDKTNGEDEKLSDDFLTLERRMKGFLGLSYSGDTIENGLERLDIVKPPYTRNHINKINDKMCQMANHRTELKNKWAEALVIMDQMEVADECETPKEKLSAGAYFINLWALEFITAIASYFSISIFTSAAKDKGLFSLEGIFFFLLTVVCVSFMFKYGFRLLRIITPLHRMKSIANALLYALKQTGHITSEQIKVCVEEPNDFVVAAYLKGGTAREKDLFAECLLQFFASVDNQRYILYRKSSANQFLRYFCVPDILAKSKESAAILKDAVEKYIGNYDLVYTRNEKGRKILLKGRSEAFANRNNELLEQNRRRRKKAKSALV